MGGAMNSEVSCWAVCKLPDGQNADSIRFESKKAAEAYKDEIIVPASMDGALLPSPRVERLADDVFSSLIQGIPTHGPCCGIVIRVGGRERLKVQKVERIDSAGHEWIALEREDGQRWPILRDENGDEIYHGVGAFRKNDQDLEETGAPLVYPMGYQCERRRNADKHLDVLPVLNLRDFAGTSYEGKTFAEYLPEGSLVRRAKPIIDEMLEDMTELFSDRPPECSCELGDDWEFKDIEERISSFPAYRIRKRRIVSASNQLILIAHELERYVLNRHPNLSTAAVTAFWTSWSVWNHFGKWSREIWNEIPGQNAYSENPIYFARAICREAWNYTRMVQALERSAMVPHGSTRVVRKSVGKAVLPGTGRVLASPRSNGLRLLSDRDRRVHDGIGGELFRTLTNAEIMKDKNSRKTLRAEGLEPSTDAAKCCVDRIRKAEGYALSRDIEEKRSKTK